MLASLVGSAVALVAVAGYAAADVFDVAPGILTLDRPVAVPTPTVSGTPAPVLLPEPAASARPDAHRHRRGRPGADQRRPGSAP